MSLGQFSALSLLPSPPLFPSSYPLSTFFRFPPRVFVTWCFHVVVGLAVRKQHCNGSFPSPPPPLKKIWLTTTMRGREEGGKGKRRATDERFNFQVEKKKTNYLRSFNFDFPPHFLLPISPFLSSHISLPVPPFPLPPSLFLSLTNK